MEKDIFVIDSKKLRKFFEILAALTDEVKLQINHEGNVFYASVVDPANVALCEVSISGVHFEKSSSVVRDVGLDVSDAMKMLNCFKSKYAQPVTLAIEQLEKGNIPQYFLGGWKFNIPEISPCVELSHHIIDPSAIRKEPKIPAIDFEIDMKIPALVLHDVVKTIKATGCNQMAIKTNATHLVFTTETNENDGQKMNYSIDRNALLDESTNKEDARSIFSMEYFGDMIKSIPKDCLVRMRFGRDYPVRLDFEPFGNGFNCMFTLAPRIEQEN
jgi:proliferating cell nuclear antigen